MIFIHNSKERIWINVADNTLICGDVEIQLPDKQKGAYVVTKQEKQKYVQEFLKAYADKVSKGNKLKISIADLPNSITQYLQIQCNFYNDAEWANRSLRDTIENFDLEYEQLKNDLFDGISVEYYQGWKNGYVLLE